MTSHKRLVYSYFSCILRAETWSCLHLASSSSFFLSFELLSPRASACISRYLGRVIMKWESCMISRRRWEGASPEDGTNLSEINSSLSRILSLSFFVSLSHFFNVCQVGVFIASFVSLPHFLSLFHLFHLFFLFSMSHFCLVLRAYTSLSSRWGDQLRDLHFYIYWHD